MLWWRDELASRQPTSLLQGHTLADPRTIVVSMRTVRPMMSAAAGFSLSATQAVGRPSASGRPTTKVKLKIGRNLDPG
jgi:hypothetical protein